MLPPPAPLKETLIVKVRKSKTQGILSLSICKSDIQLYMYTQHMHVYRICSKSRVDDIKRCVCVSQSVCICIESAIIYRPQHVFGRAYLHNRKSYDGQS